MRRNTPKDNFLILMTLGACLALGFLSLPGYKEKQAVGSLDNPETMSSLAIMKSDPIMYQVASDILTEKGLPVTLENIKKLGRDQAGSDFKFFLGIARVSPKAYEQSKQFFKENDLPMDMLSWSIFEVAKGNGYEANSQSNNSN
jgi:hypothetical protein